MSVQQHTAVTVSGLALTGALIAASTGAVIPACADAVAIAPQRVTSGSGDGSGGAAAVGPWGSAAGGGASGAPGTVIYLPNQPYNPRFLP